MVRVSDSVLREFNRRRTNVVSNSLVARLKDVLEKKKPTIRTIINTSTVCISK